ncbi:MAG: nitroreductase family protein [Sporichthyaceae bacterium]
MSSVLPLSIDEVLTTTRAVRRRLDYDRPVDPALIRECLELAQQAPSASDTQPFHFVVMTDPERRKAMADLVRRGTEIYKTVPNGLFHLHYPDDAQREAARLRILKSLEPMMERLDDVPAWVFCCVEGSLEGAPLPLYAGVLMGSVVPAAWSFMLAARSRGLGTCWMNLHQMVGPEADELIGLPPGYIQVCAIATGHTIGTEFKRAYRRPLEEIVHTDTW